MSRKPNRAERRRLQQERKQAEDSAQASSIATSLEVATLSSFPPPGQESRSDLAMLSNMILREGVDMPEPIRKAIQLRLVALIEKIAGKEDKFERAVLRLQEIMLRTEELRLKCLELQMKQGDRMAGRADTTVNVVQQVNVEQQGNETKDQLAGMLASMFSPSLVKQECNGHLSQHDSVQPLRPDE